MGYEQIELKFSSEFVGGASILLCPQCGFEYLHIAKATIHRCRDKIIIIEDNIAIKEEENTSRGVTITIEYLGECGHHGEIIFQFYKGNVEVFHRRLPELEQGYVMDIFRD